jgi:hypothetical protein
VIHATINPQIDHWLHEPHLVKKYPELKDIYRFTLPDSPGYYYVKLRYDQVVLMWC